MGLRSIGNGPSFEMDPFKGLVCSQTLRTIPALLAKALGQQVGGSAAGAAVGQGLGWRRDKCICGIMCRLFPPFLHIGGICRLDPSPRLGH